MIFNLPKSTSINRVIPKNTFDQYASSKHKKLLIDYVERIKWLNKLSSETINLPSYEILEIQIFQIELRKKDMIESILQLIDKSIPYHIVFILCFKDDILISATKKHPHPTNHNQAVIDWSFQSSWLKKNDLKFSLNLKRSIDFIFEDLCFQISGKKDLTIQELIKLESSKTCILNQIVKLESQIKKEKQFNTKVDLNQTLLDLKKELEKLL